MRAAARVAITMKRTMHQPTAPTPSPPPHSRGRPSVDWQRRLDWGRRDDPQVRAGNEISEGFTRLIFTRFSLDLVRRLHSVFTRGSLGVHSGFTWISLGFVLERMPFEHPYTTITSYLHPTGFMIPSTSKLRLKIRPTPFVSITPRGRFSVG